MITDVTGKVNFDFNDGDSLPITKCVCGYPFKSWTFILSNDKDDPNECPHCQRKLFFKNEIKVYEVE